MKLIGDYLVTASMRPGTCVAICLMCVTLLGSTPVLAQVEVLQQAELLLNKRQPAQAAALLAGYEGQLGEDPDFLYLYGLALFENGKAEQAIPYLEKATAADPLFAGVRIELARAYYQTGRLEDAQKQFEYLTTQNPPPAARRAIDEYLAAIDLQLAQNSWRSIWRFSPSTGWDSNANAATELNEFLGFVLDQRSRETASAFLDLYGSGDFSRSVGKGRTVQLGGELQGRHYPDADFADSLGLVARAGMSWAGESETRSLRLRAYRMNVDDDFNNQGLSLEGAWDYTVSPLNRVGMFARMGVLRFDDEFDNRDVDQLLLGFSGTSLLGVSRRSLVTVSALLGKDNPREADSRYGREIYGLRGFGGWRISTNLSGRINIGWQRYLYDEAFFPEVDSSRRVDKVADGSVSLVWQLKPKLESSVGLSYRDNRSNVPLFTYDRWVFSLGFSRAW
ncbi:MAG: tetratricopeptide repeat protein [Gammaproteobacteria bacterium]|nr:tetratricopeptide repeat protein [Gammaproteobacteria bacterium]